MLTISVKNFGPIAEGSVDLKPLTIFVGSSNTGKSYMATAVHAVIDRASHVGRIRTRRNQPGASIQINVPARYSGEIPGETLRILEEWVHHQLLNSSRLANQTILSLPPEVRSWLDEATIQRLNYFRGDVVDQLRQIHGSETGFVNRSSEPGGLRLFVSQDTPMMNFEICLADSSVPKPEFDISESVVPNVPPNLPPAFLGEDREEWTWPSIVEGLVNSASNSLIGKLPDQSYYLPAARSGIAQGHKVLSAALVRQSSYIGLQEMHIPTLSSITTEFLSFLISLDRRMVGRQNRSEGLQGAIAFIEATVLEGRVDLDESSGLPYPEIVYLRESSGAGAEKFTLEQTSSMVSELAPLILFLKYLVRPGDLLILEEPESHLHPAAQRQLARGIARLVNARVKVLITTHSDIIISQVNNLLALRQASEELIKQGGFEPEDFLQPERVGAYLFRHSQELGGCETVPLDIDDDTGIDEDEFATVFEAIYNESIALQRDRN